MKEENAMSTMAGDEINDRVNAGRQTIEMAPEDGAELEPRRVPPTVVVAGIGAALLGVGLLAYLLYRNRRRRTTLEQLRAALPERMSELRHQGVERMGDLRELGRERVGDLRELGRGRMGDLRELGRGRMGELRDLGDELRARLKKAL
ncbi:MAG: hypothetical protein E6I04_06195 [Chloroflexi bacterium]|nr:MAG: hypothetical protein E6I92_08470 [Chloroflexota bacterium]TMF97676.1 MAG: hypothetical protein E6I04_06195 [Chloroflexota bacterium]